MLSRFTHLFLCLIIATNAFPETTYFEATGNHVSPQLAPPVVDFSVTGTCQGEVTILTDLSTDSPTSWTWTFSPSSVTFENGTNENSQNPQVIFTLGGTYSVTLEASNVDGTNSTTKNISVYSSTTAPYTQDFSTGVPPFGWLVINPDAPAEGWEETTTTGSDGNQTKVARMDNYQYNDPGQLDELVMPGMDLTTMSNPKLYFDVAYAPYNSTNNFERLHVEYSTDCGANFDATAYDKSGATLATVPNQTSGWGPSDASHWRADTLDLTPYQSTATILKFIQTAGYGNGLFIDNVRIGTDDPPVANFKSVSDCSENTMVLSDASLNFPTSWSWSFSPSTVTYLNGTDANSQHPEIQFSAVGNYTATLTVANDLGSNTISKNISSYGMVTAPYIQDFSTGVPPFGWFIINPDAPAEGWEITTTTGSDGNQTEVARMDNYQYNDPGQLDELVMPSVDLTTMSNPKLYFDVAYAAFNSANNFERLHVEYSTDCGANFDATAYDKAGATLATVPDQGNGWGPSDASHWRADTLDLTPYQSTETILKFIQTAGYGNGLFIDNVRIGTDDPPVADFTFTTDCSQVNTTAILTDISLNFPTAWSWSFSPSTVTYLNGTDANSQNPEVQFNSVANYTVTLTATNAAGSMAISKDIGSYGTATAPYYEGFLAGVPPPEWFVTNPDAPAEGWELTETTGIDGNLTRVARVDNYQYNAVGQLDYLVMPNIDISSMINPKLYFDVAYAPYDGVNFETLYIDYSIDCGTSFSPTSYNKSGADLATVANQSSGWGPSVGSHWRTDSIDLSSYKMSTSIILRFVQIAGYGNGLFIDNIRVSNDITLPVELIRFEGRSMDCHAHLSWTSASEENFDYYEIQRSNNGIDFSNIGNLRGEGGITKQDYSYVDKETRRNNYYRLKMVDIDGSYEYSEIIFVEKSCDGDEVGIKLYPNPIGEKGFLQIEFYAAGEQEEIVYRNVQGVVVKRIILPSDIGWNTQKMDVSDLPAGTYFIHIGGYFEKLVII